jgi:hypothetical protein
MGTRIGGGVSSLFMIIRDVTFVVASYFRVMVDH